MGHRAYGIAPMTFDGMRTEAIRVGLAMVKKYLMKFNPDACIVIWDGGHDKQRTDIFPQYKKRKKQTEAEKEERKAFVAQIKLLQKCLSLLGVVQYRCKGREADDVIYNVIFECEKHFDANQYIVVSTDKDFFQLFTYWFNVNIYSPQLDKLITRKAMEKELGISAKHYVSYKALIGDMSDNLPGIKGIGPVWGKWLINNCFERPVPKEADLSVEALGMINLMVENQESFETMSELITFVDISWKEIIAGRTKNRPSSLSELQERALELCSKYGFEAFTEFFPQFIQPFENLWRKTK